MINTGDTAWVLTCTGLVMLMTPGLAFFYGGMVRRKNILGVLMQCFTVLCILTLDGFCSAIASRFHQEASLSAV